MTITIPWELIWYVFGFVSCLALFVLLAVASTKGRKPHG